MKYLSMPADFKTETIDAYHALNREYEGKGCVADTYGSIALDNRFGSGRNADKIPQVGFDQLRDYVRCAADRGIGFGYTLNASHMNNLEFTPEGIEELKAFAGRLREAGVRTLILAMPSLMELFRAVAPDMHIKASVICQITSANKAMYFKKMGAGAMTVDETINRDFDVLRRIRSAFGEHVQVVANSICHQDCQYRPFHYNQISSDSVQVTSPASGQYFTARCFCRLHDDVTNYFKATWIRPEDVGYYTRIGINYFKLQGRQTVLLGDPARAARHYIEERYDGDLKDLLFLFAPTQVQQLSVDNRRLDGFMAPFFEIDGFCKRDCSSCSYCEEFARKCFDLDAECRAGKAAADAILSRDPFVANLREAMDPASPSPEANGPS